MTTLLRNLGVTLAGASLALLCAALLQESSAAIYPGILAFALGPTSQGSWVGILAILLAFGAAGFLEPRWLKSSWPLVWVLVGPLIFLAVQCFRAFELAQCMARNAPAYCPLLYGVYLMPFVGAGAGFALRRSLQRTRSSAVGR